MMKTLTFLQPWATLVALEAKRIETRSWRTSYRWPLAIHASKEMLSVPIFLLVLAKTYKGMTKATQLLTPSHKTLIT